MGNVRQTKWNHAVLIYNNESVGTASFLTDMYFFKHLVDTQLKPVNSLCELRRTINFDFPYQTYPFLIKYVQLSTLKKD